MNLNLSSIVTNGQTVAVAVSGGSDSMALLYYMNANAKKYGIRVVALNIEHGIRGETSVKDSAFVKEYCDKNNIPLIFYAVDTLKKASEDKLSVEQAGRVLRYNCFFDAINTGKCDKVATAHHLKDNVESILLNLFRGTGLKGATGINSTFSDKIIRPFLNTDKEEILSYIKENNIPFITDETNFCDDYTRNFIRLNVLPKIKEVFPEVEKSIARFSSIAKIEDEFLDGLAIKSVTLSNGSATVKLPLEKAVFSRAVIIALKHLGIEKDWEMAHIESVYALSTNKNGAMVNLPKNVVAIKEYNAIVIYKNLDAEKLNVPFFIGEKTFNNVKLKIEEYSVTEIDLKSGIFIDKNKVPVGSVIRTKLNGDLFTKFGGGTKKLCDYFTDVKLPKRKRDGLPLLAFNNTVLAIFSTAVSDLVKADGKTEKVLKLTYEEL